MVMIPMGAKSGVIVGGLLATAVTAPADIQSSYVTVGAAVSIVTAVAVASWKTGSWFRKIVDELEASKQDRREIHATLVADRKDTENFRQVLSDRLATLNRALDRLPCRRDSEGPCPEGDK